MRVVSRALRQHSRLARQAETHGRMVGAGDKPLADTAGQLGMGESCIRGNIMSGDGVYKCTDAGRT